MRVFLIAPFALDAPRGNSVAVARLLAALTAGGTQVHAVSLADRPSVKELEQAARGFAPDLVHAVHAFHSGPTAARLAAALGVPLVVSFRGSDADECLDDMARRKAVATVAASAAVVLTLTRVMQARVAAKLPAVAPRLRVVHSGVEPSPSPRDMRRDLGIAPEGPLVVQLAALRWIKDLPRAVDLLDIAVRLRPDLRYVLAGARLEAEVAGRILPALAARPAARYAGELAHGDALALLTQAQVFLNTSVREGMSNALLEAMALGIPVVASDIPANAEAVTHEHNGLLFATAEQGAAQVVRLLGDPALGSRLAAAARVTVARGFSVAAEVEGHLRAWRDALQTRGSGS